MKKLLIALSFALPATAVSAASVTLYGGVDLGVMAQNTRTTDHAKHEKSPNVVKMISGFNYASRFGLRGKEDLGNGYSVSFILEQGFDADTGAVPAGIGGSDRAFGRESSLSLNGPFGKLTAGRLGVLSFFQSTGIIKGNVFGVAPDNSSSFNKGRGLSFGRADNAVAYTTPSMGGFTLHLMYSNNYDDVKETKEGDNKWSDNNHYYGIGGKYTSKTIEASVIAEKVDYKHTKYPTAKEPHYKVTAGGSYNFGPFKQYAIYQFNDQDKALKSHAFALGWAIPAAGGTVKAQARYIMTRDINDKDKSNEWTLGAEYDYPLSKRSFIWTFAGYSDSDKFYKEQNNILYNGWQVGLGLVHRF